MLLQQQSAMLGISGRAAVCGGGAFVGLKGTEVRVLSAPLRPRASAGRGRLAVGAAAGGAGFGGPGRHRASGELTVHAAVHAVICSTQQPGCSAPACTSMLFICCPCIARDPSSPLQVVVLEAQLAASAEARKSLVQRFSTLEQLVGRGLWVGLLVWRGCTVRWRRSWWLAACVCGCLYGEAAFPAIGGSACSSQPDFSANSFTLCREQVMKPQLAAAATASASFDELEEARRESAAAAALAAEKGAEAERQAEAARDLAEQLAAAQREAEEARGLAERLRATQADAAATSELQAQLEAAQREAAAATDLAMQLEGEQRAAEEAAEQLAEQLAAAQREAAAAQQLAAEREAEALLEAQAAESLTQQLEEARVNAAAEVRRRRLRARAGKRED